MKTPVFTLDRIKTGDKSMLLPSLLQSTLSVNWFKLTSGYLDPIPQHDIPWELSPTVRDMAGGWMNVNGDDVSVLIIVYQYTLVIWRYNTGMEHTAVMGNTSGEYPEYRTEHTGWNLMNYFSGFQDCFTNLPLPQNCLERREVATKERKK